jgi:hypothetical protein
VAGIDISPEDGDSPYPPAKNTGQNVTIRNVRVSRLVLNIREHSITGSLSMSTGALTYAVGMLGEILPEWYRLRRKAFARRGGEPQWSYPSLNREARPRLLTTEFPIKVAGGSPPDDQRPVWVRGVDRIGKPLRGAQGILVAGVLNDSVTFSNVFVEDPVVRTLPARVILPAPSGVENIDLRVTNKASRVAVVPARTFTDAPATACCSVNTTQNKVISSLSLFSGASFSIRAGYPPGGTPPLFQGTMFGVNAPRPLC